MKMQRRRGPKPFTPPSFKLASPNGRGLRGYMDQLMVLAATNGVDRSIAPSYWCDCKKSNLDYLGRASASTAKGANDAYAMVPTTTVTYDNLCTHCGNYAVVRRIPQDQWPERAVAIPKGAAYSCLQREVFCVDANSGAKTVFGSKKEATMFNKGCLSYALKTGKLLNGKRWGYVDGRPTIARSHRGRKKKKNGVTS